MEDNESNAETSCGIQPDISSALVDIGKGSDCLSTDSQNMDTDIHCEPKTEKQCPLIDCPINLYGLINAHQGDLKGVEYGASIVGGAFLEQNIVLIDKGNSLLLVYDDNFTLKTYLKLPTKPLGLCSIDEKIVIISCEDKKVQRYIISDHMASLLNDFSTKLHCRGISSAGTNVALLLSDEGYDTEIDNKDVIEVQIRNVKNGHKIREGDNFFDKGGKPVKMKNPRCLLYTNDNHCLIGENKYLADFDENFKRQRFFKSYKHHQIGDIRAVASDNEGNIYVCGYETDNVHQVSLDNFFQNRILIPNIQDPCCIAFDTKRKRLLVGCLNSNLVHIYHFQRGKM